MKKFTVLEKLRKLAQIYSPDDPGEEETIRLPGEEEEEETGEEEEALPGARPDISGISSSPGDDLTDEESALTPTVKVTPATQIPPGQDPVLQKYLSSPPPKGLKIEKKYAPYYLAWKETKDPRYKEQLLNSMNSLINQLIIRYAGMEGSRSRPLKLYARAILARNLEKYDPTKYPLSTFAFTYLQELQRKYRPLRNPFTLSERKEIELTRFQSEWINLQEELGREPTIEEMADRMSISRKKAQELYSEWSGRKYTTPGYIVAAESKMPGIQRKMDPAVLDYIYYSLPSQEEKLVFEYIYGLHGKKQMKPVEIARKLKTSPSKITRMMTKWREMFQAVASEV